MSKLKSLMNKLNFIHLKIKSFFNRNKVYVLETTDFEIYGILDTKLIHNRKIFEYKSVYFSGCTYCECKHICDKTGMTCFINTPTPKGWREI